ncbi:hypothetical protein ANT2_1309 [plant metagenome]|uniref:Uncharacterized protein n=1 Tax=plant metagenome TaxID=1297885 RepID=A0A484TFI5_9ZZZZ
MFPVKSAPPSRKKASPLPLRGLCAALSLALGKMWSVARNFQRGSAG